MPRTEVYSWRLTPSLKQRLEARAREEGVSLSELLDRIAGDWLVASGDPDDADAQRRLHAAVEATSGTLAGGDPSRSRRAREIVAARVRSKAGGRRRNPGA